MFIVIREEEDDSVSKFNQYLTYEERLHVLRMRKETKDRIAKSLDKYIGDHRKIKSSLAYTEDEIDRMYNNTTGLKQPEDTSKKDV